MAAMVNSSRLSNGVKSTALMRRAHHDAMTVAKNRVVFGSRIIDLPLARRQLMKIMLATEQALSMSFVTADALDRGEAGSQDAAALLRILCLLYTSDAADDLLCVDLGGRRIIKK